MIKRIRFATRRADLSPTEFARRWRAVGEAAAGAPAGTQPHRIAVCTSLPDVIPDPRHDGVVIEWFVDAEHLARFEGWLQGAAGEVVAGCLDRAVDVAVSPVMVANEMVMRGGDWLAARWDQSGDVSGDKIKHMAIARRAPQLTAEAFSERWRSRAGTVGSGQGPAVTIPDEARGLAYVQNHPRPDRADSSVYDAFNEVYFDSVDDLLVRIAWFDANLRGPAEADLISESWFLACREELV